MRRFRLMKKWMTLFLVLLMIEFVLAREPWTLRKKGGKNGKEAAA